jgi:glycosyltransferase involved in cell wall biosynthesis
VGKHYFQEKTTLMRVLFASHDRTIKGGAERSLFELVVALKADGNIEPIVVVPGEDELSKRLQQNGITCHVLRTTLWADHPADFASVRIFGGTYLRLRRLACVAVTVPYWISLIRRVRPSVVVTNTAVIPVPSIAAFLCRIPHVWWVQEFVSADHGLDYVLGERISQKLIGYLSDRVITNSNAVSKHFAQNIPVAKIKLIPYQVTKYDTQPNRVEPGQLRLLFLGRQSLSKGADLAIKALALLQKDCFDYRLRFVGASEEAFRSKLARLAQDLGVARRIEFIEHCIDPRVHFDWCNVLLMCSSNEAFGRVSAEALKAGRPVIGSAIGGTIEIVSNEVDGLLYTPGSAESLARCIQRIAEDPDLLRMMSRAALTRNKLRFSAEKQVEDFVSLLRRIGNGASKWSD